ncbi:hypothetical protein [Peribacillus alkalitolerans]|uniref:YfjL-like protein n=1 Tax=Peribacillus alkalitolerans TaxID=1550385 RepID=UPI0013D29771|nr:hypothetical protein [Peribacillus alkalitolerans]
MKVKKIIIMIISFTIVIVIAYLFKGFYGNPIDKKNAKKEVLTYFEDKYKKEFIVYSADYNFLIPDYNIRLGPKGDKDAIIETSKYELTMYDAYGAYLASKELESKMHNIIKKDYPGLKFTVVAEEEHHIEVAGVQFDFFTTDPMTRLEKNYFMATVTWKDTGLSNDETIRLMDEMALKINEGLRGTPQQLSLDILVKNKNGDNDINYRFYVNGKVILKN